MLFEIDRWHREHKEETKTARQSGIIDPFPPEAHYAKKFDVIWPHAIDWTNWAYYEGEDHPSNSGYDARKASENLIDDAISLVGHTVIATNPDQTWMTLQPFEGILKTLGAETIGYDMEMTIEEGFGFHAILRFTAPNQQIADQIEREISQYVAGELSSSDNLPPWHDDEANFNQVLDTSKLLKRDAVEILKKKWQLRYDRSNYLPNSPYSLSMKPNRLALRSKELRLDRKEQKFVLSHMWFHNQELGVSAMIAWLEVKGCFDIDYRYVRD